MRQLLPGAPAADDLGAVYAWPAGRCVRVNFVASVDGAATGDGRSEPLSSPVDKAVFRHLRATCDVVLVGAGTARVERYRPAAVPVAVVTNRLSLDTDDRLFAGTPGTARPLVFVPASVAGDRRDAVAAHAEVIDAGHDEVDLATVVDLLEARGLRRVLCEGGPVLFGSMLSAGLVDELCLTIAPLLVGGDAPRIVQGARAGPLDLTLLSAIEASGQLLLRYAVG